MPCEGEAEADALETAADVSDSVGAVVGDRVLLGMVRPDRVVLDVPDLVADLLEPSQPVEIQPGLTAERATAHHPEHDESQRLSCHFEVRARASMS